MTFLDGLIVGVSKFTGLDDLVFDKDTKKLLVDDLQKPKQLG
jgi:hypothetical protein